MPQKVPPSKNNPMPSDPEGLGCDNGGNSLPQNELKKGSG